MSLEGNVQEGRTLTGKVVMLRPVDATLTKSGYAADAKVVGDSIRASVQMDDALRTLIDEIDPHNADKVNYDNATSGLIAGNVQSAIDEIISRKPESSYKGNGNATARAVEIGGSGKLLVIYGSAGIVFACPYGCFAVNNAGVSSFIPVAQAYFSNGVLNLITASDMLNKNGSTYPYILL